ncbi:MAG: hypothetical protein JO003_04785 [Candidatus Eremiobacteraeota bacterium]|nr:hypothetical protein [Candidatus Eremiobacteraeota bacterium]
MTGLGLDAGGTLVNVFAAEDDAPGWKGHRWLRYTASMGALTRWAVGYQCGYAPLRELPAQATYESLIHERAAAQLPGVAVATDALVALPIDQAFYDLETPPIAVLPTRPVV